MDNLKEVMAIQNVHLEELEFKGNKVGHFAVTDGEKVFGVVSERYQPVSHATVLAHVREWLPDGKVESVYTAGKNLSRVVFNIALPKLYELNGDSSPIETRVNLRNSLDGGWTIGLIVSPVRVVCTNTFALHFKEAFISLSEKHYKTGVNRFMNSLPVVEKVYSAMEGQIKVAQELIKQPCTTEKGREFLRRLVEKKVLPERTAEKVSTLFEHPTRPEDEQWNMWGLFNSATDVLSRNLENKGKVSSLDKIYDVGEAFSELVSVR